MANSRFDNIRYFDNEFKVPNQIKVYDGSSWVDLGEKNSFNTKKLVVHDGSNFDCVTYYRNDVNIPSTIELGSGKYLNIRKSNGTYAAVDSYHNGYIVDMIVEVNETTPLYTCYSKNIGDITNQAYINYVAEVSGNSVRLQLKTHFSGNRISDGKYVNSTLTKYTDYVATKGDKIHIVITRAAIGNSSNVKIYNSVGTELCNTNLGECTQWVGTPNIHRVGSETTKTSGTQGTKGNAKLHYFKFTPTSDRTKIFEVSINNQVTGGTTLQSSGTYTGYLEAVGTSVYGSSYTEYIRQTI